MKSVPRSEIPSTNNNVSEFEMDPDASNTPMFERVIKAMNYMKLHHTSGVQSMEIKIHPGKLPAFEPYEKRENE